MSWLDNKEISLEVDAISWISLSDKRISSRVDTMIIDWNSLSLSQKKKRKKWKNEKLYGKCVVLLYKTSLLRVKYYLVPKLYKEVCFWSLNFKKFFFSSLNFIKSFFNSLETKIGMKKNNFFNSLGVKNKLLVKFKDMNKTFLII